MNIKDFKKIGFDLDGTLIDSLDGIYCSYETSAKNLNLEIFPKNIIKKNIGPPIDIFFAKLYPDYQFLKNQYSILFREHYLCDGYKKTKLKDNTYFLLDLLLVHPESKNIVLISYIKTFFSNKFFFIIHHNLNRNCRENGLYTISLKRQQKGAT